jgi:hypothetical protein
MAMAMAIEAAVLYYFGEKAACFAHNMCSPQ